MIKQFLQGIGVGISIILPGMSGGTAFLILGIYHRLINDLANLYLRPYIILSLGTLTGIVCGTSLLNLLLEKFTNIITSFLLGALLASIRFVFGKESIKDFLQIKHLLWLTAGIIIGWVFAVEPLTKFHPFPVKNWPLLFIGGLLSSITMILPGISGSSMLIIINLYNDILAALNQWHFPSLFAFGLGGAIGLFGFARMIHSIFQQHRQPISFLIGGLILGSSRTLFPTVLSYINVAFMVTGAFLVLVVAKRQNI